MKTIIASRKLVLNEKPLTINLHLPEQLASGDYECTAECMEDKSIAFPLVMGIDSFQAIILMLEVIRKQLRDHSEEITWELGESGDLGFPIIPIGAYLLGDEYRRKFEMSLEKQISDDHKSFIKRAKAKLEKKSLR